MFVAVVMVALRPFRLGITLGLGDGAAHAGGNAFLESGKNPLKRGHMGSATYMVLCLERVNWAEKQGKKGVFRQPRKIEDVD